MLLPPQLRLPQPLQAPEGRQSQCQSAPAKAGGGRPACRPSLLPVCLTSRTRLHPGPLDPQAGRLERAALRTPAPGVRRPGGSKNRHPTHTRGGWGSRKSRFISDPCNEGSPHYSVVLLA